MEGDLVPSGVAFGYDLLDMWKEVLANNKNFMRGYLQNDPDEETLAEFISSVQVLYVALSAKMKDREEFKDKAVKFKSYHTLMADPKAFYEDGNFPKIFDCLSLIAELLEEMKITKFEK